MRNFLFVILGMAITSCNTTDHPIEQPETKASTIVSEDRKLSQQFNDYWYAGDAEISSYALSQSRYGEMREGNAVMVFVTEPFDATDHIKADQPKESNRPILKLNATRDFVTGIYPYHIMSSTFFPLDKVENPIKVATSIQEWCGHTYMQLNEQNDSYEVTLHSYFQSEGNRNFSVDNVLLENQIPLQLRLGPEAMPLGELEAIPSTEFLRLKHVETRPYKAVAKLRTMDDGYVYSLNYPELDRTIAFKTGLHFPYRIVSWMDRYMDGGRPMVSTATLKKSMKSAYWGKNGRQDEVLRDSLKL